MLLVVLKPHHSLDMCMHVLWAIRRFPHLAMFLLNAEVGRS